ncbi:hypothetical protein DMR_09460 [Solidesulfovibrio magneticus RS-1]|uniref:Uncharacterized protein n=1 Tax=Solidesulfovibrio magneticus (strain ATCC 700980 / DSM 13731 / RS-1) TaxID=573370 RepID=C4XKP6_SOLM1|nr:hypothetical protein DMR_09460 [Solidesulfovibrio magneticus RS-1]
MLTHPLLSHNSLAVLQKQKLFPQKEQKELLATFKTRFANFLQFSKNCFENKELAKSKEMGQKFFLKLFF